MRKSILPALLVAFGALAFAQSNIIKIATVSPLSGEQAALGEMIKLGAQLAVEEAQPEFEKLGFRLELAPQDDQANPDVGVAVARRLVTDPDVLAVVGHLNTGVAIPSSEVYKDYQLPMVSPANTGPAVTDRCYLNIDRLVGRDDVQGPAGAEFAVKTLGAKRIFVVHDKTTYGQGVAEQFKIKAEELGAKVVAFVGTEEKSNFQALILQMKASRPDFVYFGGIYNQGAVLLKQMRERGIKATFMGPDGLDSSKFVEIAGDAAKGAYYTTVAGPIDQYPKAKAMAEKFKQRFGKEPESFAIYGYDSANVVIAALKSFIEQAKRKPTRAELSMLIRQTQISGVTGDVAFDYKGDRKKADYFVVHLAEAKYPGTVAKVISFPAPASVCKSIR